MAPGAMSMSPGWPNQSSVFHTHLSEQFWALQVLEDPMVKVRRHVVKRAVLAILEPDPKLVFGTSFDSENLVQRLT